MLKSRIELDAVYGRSLVTTEVVRKGELVVEETPFAFGPLLGGPIVCLNCYRGLQFSDGGVLLDRCKICTWPLCNECTSYESGTHNLECKVFAGSHVPFAGNIDNKGVCTQLDCITPLRVLLAKEIDPIRWECEVSPMEDHEHARRSKVDMWYADRVNIALYLRGPCKLANKFSEELIMRVVGILEVNAFEARTVQGYPFRCLYPLTGILAHNCVPNTARSIYPSENYKIRLRAMCELEAGTPLYHSYTYTTDGTLQRQAHLKAGKFFTCTCLRCLDPMELGTDFSTLRCRKCTDGWLISENPLDGKAAWRCKKCKFETAGHTIHQIVTLLKSEVAAVQASDMDPTRIKQSEQLLRKYRSILHPSHFIQIGLYQDLITMYGHVRGYEMAHLPKALLKRKVKLCRKVLHVLNVFEPGLSRSRAVCLYELQLPLVQLAKNCFVTGTISRESLRMRLIEASEILKECADILKYEDSTSEAGSLGQVSRQALAQLNLNIVELS